MRARPNPRPRSWSSEWLAQTIGRCTTCTRDRDLMLIEDGATVCHECHEARLEEWRREDIEAERREALWDVWTLVANGHLR